mgnify:CR=1 FL=1
MYKLLIASNQKPWRLHVKDLLLPYEFNVCGEAQNFDETLLLSELHLPNIILFNFKYALREQLALISSISQLGTSVKILVFSPNPIRRSTWSYIRAGACALLQPDTNDDEFISVVRGSLAGYTLAPFNRLSEPNPKVARRKYGPP